MYVEWVGVVTCTGVYNCTDINIVQCTCTLYIVPPISDAETQNVNVNMQHDFVCIMKLIHCKLHVYM